MFLARTAFGAYLAGEAYGEAHSAEVSMVAARVNEPERDDPDTQPDTALDTELAEAVEWLKRAGVVHENKPPFVGFFHEVVNSAEGDAEK